MDIFRLSIALSDPALASALARAIAKEYAYIHAVIGETEDADFTIRDEFLGAPAPVREIVDRALAASGKSFSFPSRPSSCPLTSFTAGGGGRGVSTFALYYAAVLAQEKRVLLLTFDPYAPPTDSLAGMELLHCVLDGRTAPLKAACIPDASGIFRPAQSSLHNLFFDMTAEEIASFLEKAEDSGEWDEIVLDVPRGHPHWKQILNMCERRIVLCCSDGATFDPDEAAYRELQELEMLMGPGETLPLLWLHFLRKDEPIPKGEPDLCSQFGCEVSSFAQKLAAQ